MNAVKKELKFFGITEYEQEGEYLRRMHKQGWKFTNVRFPGIYSFEECVPEDVVYQLDYNQEGLNHRDEYFQMFRDCGWEHLLEYVGYSYFRKSAAEMQEDEGIFCDESSRLAMLRRVFVGRLIPLIVIFCCTIVPQLFFQSLRGEAGRVFFKIFLALFVIYAAIFANFAGKYFSYIKNSRK